jgi:eukaryotic-like serine/threonine-protein kinase
LNQHRSSSSAAQPVGGEDDSEALRVLDSYLSGIEAGLPADPQKLLADHPQLADQLRAYLNVMKMTARLAGDAGGRNGLRPAGPSPGDETMLPPQSSWREGREELPISFGSSRISTIELGPGALPQVQLREPPNDGDSLVRPRSVDMPDGDHRGACRYRLEGEIARGGMGAIIKGFDLDLGRELAIKVLLEPHRDNPQVVCRFVEEAQIGGQLQHPGVVPVYDLGTLPDRRPYFAMKLVKGQTLSTLLRVRTGPEHELARFLGIFEQICQTMAYAHARGVVHRDLKPSNVMVGTFGEVQVMDWGLAKVLSRELVADEAAAGSDRSTVIATVRSGPVGSGGESQAGSVLGTPAYMAPEQARGDVGRLDERVDVFGLGAILCEILTGRPPYVGPTREEVYARAARGDLADALGRLDASEVDAELIDLARDCLAVDPESRPRSAGELVQRLNAYLDGVQERLQLAELARVEAQARAEEEEKRRLVADELVREARARADGERYRRRLTVALAASVLVTAGVIGGGWNFLARLRAARSVATTRAVTEALADAERLRGQAQSSAVGDLTRWTEARGTALRARDLLDRGEVDDALRARVLAVLADLQREQAAAARRADEIARERALLTRLEVIRGDRSENWDAKRCDEDYAAAFREFGLDVDRLDPEETGKQIARRSDPVELASYLDDWAMTRRHARDKKDAATWQRLLAAASAADSDPWRVALRDQIEGRDPQALPQLADNEKELEAQSSTSLVLLAVRLIERGERRRAEQVLQCAWRMAPNDFWVNYEMSRVYKVGRHFVPPESAIRYGSAAVAIRPRSFAARIELGMALNDARKLPEAAAQFREVVKIQPDDAYARNNLAAVLAQQGKYEEAASEFREVIRLKPDYVSPHDGLGNVLCSLARPAEAVEEYRTVLRLQPDFALTYGNLSYALRLQRKFDEAIEACRTALRLQADFPEAQYSLALALRGRGQFAEAVAEMRKARDMAPKDSDLLRQIVHTLAATERQAALVSRLPAIVAGETAPRDAAEVIDLAQVCSIKGLNGASARFWADAFRANPKMVDDVARHWRYSAACAAALAGCGRGNDQPPLDETSRARWRRRALEWLEADLAAWSGILERGPRPARQPIPGMLRHWKDDPDLAGLRDPAALEKLPEDQQKACRSLWIQVDALLARTGRGNSP